MDKYEKLRVQALLPKNIIAKLDEFAKEMGLSRSNAISVITKTYLDQQEIIKLSESVRKDIPNI